MLSKNIQIYGKIFTRDVLNQNADFKTVCETIISVFLGEKQLSGKNTGSETERSGPPLGHVCGGGTVGSSIGWGCGDEG